MRAFLVFTLIFMLTACEEPPEPSHRLAISPWPGYEYLYLAEQLGYFDEVGLDLRIVQMSTMADVKRAYINQKVDLMASTLVEAVKANELSGRPLNVVLVTDYSSGGNMIVTNKQVMSVPELRGKRIGCEVSAQGLYMLKRALQEHGMSIDDVEVVNVEQLDGQRELTLGSIDAFVTYPPYALNVVQDESFHVIFSSKSLPKEMIDTVSIDAQLITKAPDLVPKLHQAWQKALTYSEQHPEQAVSIMAHRQGISTADYVSTMEDLKLLDYRQQRLIFAQPDALQDKAINVCEVLVMIGALVTDCSQLNNLVYRGSLE